MNARLRLALACAGTLAILAPLGWLWQRSLLPSSYSVMDMGYVDVGGGPAMPHHGHSAVRSVRELVDDPDRTADVHADLIARKARVRLASGRRIDGYNLNGRSPGPLIRVRAGQLLEVRLRNANVPDGVSLHWHGVDLPNAEDGVAGVTQDAVMPGQTHTYRFVADDPGTYWYHSHQVSHEQVRAGLFGALVVEPTEPCPGCSSAVTAVAHTYDGIRTLNGRERVVRVDPGLAADRLVRVRVINTDNATVQAWASAPFTVAALDGRDLHQPAPVAGRRLAVPAGGRADLLARVPRGRAIRVQVGAATALVIGDRATSVPPKPRQPITALDLLTYGSADPDAERPSARKPDRHFNYSIGRRLGFQRGIPGYWWTVNGHLFPDVPMYVVREGDLVAFHVDNHSGESHPMHLHGHHARLLAVDGRPATGSPLWLDSIDVASGQSVDLEFTADNPGIWLDHCHNLTHAAQGLVAHLMYEGVTTPYVVGGRAGNRPE